MSQFQVYANPRPSRTQVPFLLDIQSDVVAVGTRLVIPLVHEEAFGARLPRLNPLLKVAGTPVVMSTADMAGLPSRELRQPVADLNERRGEIMSAVDFLLLGF